MSYAARRPTEGTFAARSAPGSRRRVPEDASSTVRRTTRTMVAMRSAPGPPSDASHAAFGFMAGTAARSTPGTRERRKFDAIHPAPSHAGVGRGALFPDRQGRRAGGANHAAFHSLPSGEISVLLEPRISQSREIARGALGTWPAGEPPASEEPPHAVTRRVWPLRPPQTARGEAGG